MIAKRKTAAKRKAAKAVIPTILVTGDPICDHSYYRGIRATADSPEERGFRFMRTGGGALLLKDLIETTRSQTTELSAWKTAFGLNSDYESLPPTYHAFALWEPQLANPQEKDAKKQIHVWRAVEPLLGYGHKGSKGAAESTAKPRAEAILPPEQPIKDPPQILVIDDAGLGFRDSAHSTHWGGLNAGPRPQWIVLKLSGSIGQGELWKELVTRCRERLVLIVSADQLRRNNVRLSRGLSWEATVEDLTAELDRNPLLKPLSLARHLVVTFRSDAAFWVNNKPNAKTSLLVFDAERAEGEWAECQGTGTVFGFQSCLTASVVRQLCLAGNDPDLEPALIAGLAAGRELRVLGHGRVIIQQKQADGSEKPVDNPSPGFPFAAIAAQINEPKHKFVSALIPQDLKDRGNWMMLDEWQVHARSNEHPRPHFEAAMAVAIVGPEALERFPVARFGGLQTVDRKEIESLRTLRQLIDTYQKGGAQKKPLSLGVFGPPGAGKSFGVTQIALAVLGLKEEDILTFNLSQFSDPADLNGAFHRVRDRALSGVTPLVFWDEFDSQGYKWLQYLLAPMQDGAFQDGQITHPIGKCVFVFAGATSPTFSTFGPRSPHSMPPKELIRLRRDAAQMRAVEEEWLQFVLKKGPDFKSRLVGYLNVLGPNLRQRCIEAEGRRRWVEDETDLCYPIRRALFIRSQFKLKDGQTLKLDSGVLKALLEIHHYKSGARSLEFLCQQLKQSSATTPTRSNLPGQEFLHMHVDAAEFWELCERENAFIPMSLELASALHEGYRLGIKGNPKKAALDVPFAQLKSDKQRANIAQALRIPRILQLVGLKLLPGPRVRAEDLAASRKPNEKPIRRLIAQADHLELMAEAEHNGWMVERMLDGWKFSRHRDDDNKRHNLLIPYSQLTKTDKDYDRHTIAGDRPGNGQRERFGYVDLVKIAGFRVAKI